MHKQSLHQMLASLCSYHGLPNTGWPVRQSCPARVTDFRCHMALYMPCIFRARNDFYIDLHNPSLLLSVRTYRVFGKYCPISSIWRLRNFSGVRIFYKYAPQSNERVSVATKLKQYTCRRNFVVRRMRNSPYIVALLPKPQGGQSSLIMKH